MLDNIVYTVLQKIRQEFVEFEFVGSKIKQNWKSVFTHKSLTPSLESCKLSISTELLDMLSRKNGKSIYPNKYLNRMFYHVDTDYWKM